jgi:hypothetical protein
MAAGAINQQWDNFSEAQVQKLKLNRYRRQATVKTSVILVE